jgi:hypothetical protein
MKDDRFSHADKTLNEVDVERLKYCFLNAAYPLAVDASDDRCSRGRECAGEATGQSTGHI